MKILIKILLLFFISTLSFPTYSCIEELNSLYNLSLNTNQIEKINNIINTSIEKTESNLGKIDLNNILKLSQPKNKALVKVLNKISNNKLSTYKMNQQIDYLYSILFPKNKSIELLLVREYHKFLIQSDKKFSTSTIPNSAWENLKKIYSSSPFKITEDLFFSYLFYTDFNMILPTRSYQLNLPKEEIIFIEKFGIKRWREVNYKKYELRDKLLKTYNITKNIYLLYVGYAFYNLAMESYESWESLNKEQKSEQAAEILISMSEESTEEIKELSQSLQRDENIEILEVAIENSILNNSFDSQKVEEWIVELNLDSEIIDSQLGQKYKELLNF